MSRAYASTVVVACSMVFCVGCFAQAATPQSTPQHPIDTRPEGQKPTCSYSVNRTNGAATGDSTCPKVDPNAGSAAQRFPFPGEQEPSRATTVPATPNAGQTDAPAPQAGSAAKRFPFPGEDATPAAKSPLQDAGSSGESTSSSSSSADSALPPDDNAGTSADALPAPKRARKKLPPTPRQSPDEREEEDLKVAAFYQNDGNFRAAYLRAKDAVVITETDPEAQFALAEAARKLGKFDEAQKAYKRCLELDPVPKIRKTSEKALKEMSGS